MNNARACLRLVHMSVPTLPPGAGLISRRVGPRPRSQTQALWRQTQPSSESQLHLMMEAGWSTCRLGCSSFVTPGSTYDHSSRPWHPALLPAPRQCIQVHHQCSHLCLTARKRKIKSPVTRHCGGRGTGGAGAVSCPEPASLRHHKRKRRVISDPHR